MSKDPALLVYTKDFLEGTADLEPEEMGVYCRLIFHQHQRGILPNDTKKLARLGGVSPSEFEEIWPNISHKFEAKDGGWINERCDREAKERSLNVRRRSVLAILGNWVKTSDHKNDVIFAAKKWFSFDKYLDIEDDNDRKNKIIKDLSNFAKNHVERNAKRSHIADGDADANEDVVVVKKGVQGEIDVGDTGEPSFQDFWDKYSKKVDTAKCKAKWIKLKATEKQAIMDHLDEYIPATPDKQYRRNPLTYLNNRTWEDEELPTFGSRNGRLAVHDTTKNAKGRHERTGFDE